MTAQCDLGGVEITSIYTNRSADPAGIDTDGDGVIETTDEFVEICNTGSTTADISGWTLGDHSSGPAEYTFPGGTTMAPGKCIVLVTDWTGTAPPCVVDLNDPTPWISEPGEVINLSDGTDAISATWGSLDCADAPANAVCCEEWCAPEPECVNLSGACGEANPGCDYLPEALLIALPVEMKSFDVVEERGDVLIEWSTATEINNDYFSIDWSTDAKNFESVGTEESRSARGYDYTFTHTDASAGINYYRLTQYDLNGTETRSEVKSVMIEKEMDVRISSTVVEDQFSVRGDDIERVMIFTRGGQLILESDGGSTFNLSNFSEGMYIVRIESSSNSMTKRIMKI